MNPWWKYFASAVSWFKKISVGWPWPARRTLVCSLITGLLLVELAGFYLAYRTVKPTVVEAVAREPKSAEQWRIANDRLRQKIASQRPKAEYLVIDTARNRVTLRKGESVLRDMLASCGSGSVLEDPASSRRWVFDTPRGLHRVQSKVKNPLWIKPDWAFLEAGLPVPTNPSQRAEAGVMGDYALGLGKGYFIHGTLYKRMLGRNVSHGCVRLGDEDLAYLYRSIPLGTKVIVF